MEDLRVASVQFQHRPGDKQYNLDRIEHFVQQAAQHDVGLINFPECCISGYWHLRLLDRRALAELAEPVPSGPSTDQLLKLAAKFGMTISAGLVEREGERLFNTQVIAMPNGVVHRHRKLHCFVSEHMESGDEFTVFDLPTGQKVGVLICYDNNIVENVRATSLLGADIILSPHQTGGCKSGSPFAMGRIDVELWENRERDPASIESEINGDKGRGWLMRWLPSRAHDNGVFVVFANGIGRDDNEVRTGGSMILDPYGRIVAETIRAADDMVWADLDGSLRERSTGARWIRARRPELYRLLCESHNESPTRDVRFEFDDDQ